MEQEKSSKVNPTQSMRDAMKKATTEMLVLFMLRQKPMYTYYYSIYTYRSGTSLCWAIDV